MWYLIVSIPDLCTLTYFYDENTQDRNFEPRDKVLALLTIPGKPLQARYYSPYTVDKKLSDVYYTINTVGGANKNSYVISTCLKSTLIGIVLLFDRDSSVISSVNRGFIKRREAGIYPFYSGMFPLLHLINFV